MKAKVIKSFTHRQSGSALVISLIILVAMTLIGITAMRTTVLEEKMAGNMRNKEIAFQAAEATLRAAERYIQNNVISTVAFDTDGSDGLYNHDDVRIWENINWTDADSLEYSDFGSYNVATPPRFVIQHLSTTGDSDKVVLDNIGEGTGGGNVETFLITARGTGTTNNAVVYIQSTWGIRLGS
jgi:type IV pilus assembly protein PilX